MFHYLYYSVAINESKEKFRIVFCCFSAIKIIIAWTSSSNIPTMLIFETYSYFFDLINVFQWVYNICEDTNKLIVFLFYDHCFLTFWQVFHTLLVCFLLADQKVVLYQY